ncbi:MAG TPA: 3-deoxy-7-phosphoheptulonate synthase [Candidatus Stackebrandtia excrementipullorum]|nr:3-deoxy-7-phosphoheptulonate synthase [Candidatus Stackebrandtia excrementipullorum]
MTASLPTPASTRSSQHGPAVKDQRQQVSDILSGKDDRLLVIAGPCSAHDDRSIIDYTAELARMGAEHSSELYVVARVYTEKPRTRLGWPGMLLDPHLDSTYRVRHGIEMARGMLETVADIGVPIACEFVEPLLADFLSDLVCWGAIGARTVESPPHRRLASGLPMPVGFKNRADGAVRPAVDAVVAAAAAQPMISLSDDGTPRSWISEGNPRAHVVLRGGDHGPNHSCDDVGNALELLAEVQPSPRLIVDCSHGNSGKDHRRQPLVAADVAGQVSAGQTGIAGVMLESFIHEGSQPHSADPRPGLSITDSCLGLAQTGDVMAELAEAVHKRRQTVSVDMGEAS